MDLVIAANIAIRARIVSNVSYGINLFAQLGSAITVNNDG